MLIKTENRSLEELQEIGTAMQQSGFFTDIKNAQQALVKILAGREMGFPSFASMNGVNIIKGKPTISANLMASAVKRSGKYNYQIKELNDKKASIEFLEIRNGKYISLGISDFTIDESARAKLVDKDNWRNYPKNMLFARAISNGIRFYCPEVMSGNVVYTPDELGKNEDDNGNLIAYNSNDKKQSNKKQDALPILEFDFDKLKEKIETSLNNCNDIDKLRVIYQSVPNGQKKILLPLFEDRKEELLTDNQPLSPVIQPEELTTVEQSNNMDTYVGCDKS